MFGKKEESQAVKIERIREKNKSGDILGSTIALDFSIIFKLAIGLIIIFGLIYFYRDSDGFVNVTKEYEYVESLKNIKRPSTKSEEGGTTIEIAGEKVEFSYIASVNISGRVLFDRKAMEYNFTNKVSPVSVVMSWGDLAKNKYSKLVTFTPSGDRGYMYQISEEAIEDAPQMKNLMNNNCTNCILIPANKEIKALIKMINTDDYIRMEGYVVNIDCQKKKGGSFRWRSGYDSSNFAKGKSKLLLVNKIVWLESNES